ncbi:DNA repair protein RecN [Desulforhopalus vacuolatus]|uniref:DNA repair protein RecN n=1 Tax=Desulforhopalus vacuolatus TaxID=40414 RepID=UPI00196486BA|nr:DNA repair protein RecN [Desulforhopalus vacuolatus]MBM9520160.1 DNA repair protein RecN [Desulforhopalus vacuolatus]
MLCELRIKNLALIEALELNFEQPGSGAGSLVVMTGETGAGKSVMLRAIHLLSGRRASVEWIRSGESNCEVEALFEIDSHHWRLLERLEEGGFGGNTKLIIRRVLSANGRSRFYVNGSLATGKLVGELAVELLNVASQHDQQRLLQTGVHLDLLDTIGDLQGQKKAYTEHYRQWQEKKAEMAVLLQEEQEKEQRLDLLRFQLGEIHAASLQPQEDDALVVEKKRLKNGQSLMELCRESHYLLSGTLMDELSQLRQNVIQIATLDDTADKLAEEISDYTFKAEDLVQELRNYQGSLESNPVRLEHIHERLDLLSQLKRKYGETLEQIFEFVASGEEELQHLENMEREMNALAAEVAALEEEVFVLGSKLSSMRRKTAIAMEGAMVDELASLSFNRPIFEVNFAAPDMSREGALAVAGPDGWDTVEFFFSANPGEAARPLAKIASGGELSRLLLAIKCLLAKKDMVETVIFDEVDTGIGGEAAEAVARKIQELAGHHQVFCITHLPQIAARGGLHLEVVKSVQGERTRTDVKVLGKEERVVELVRMLAGDSATEQTEAWARDLLGKRMKRSSLRD